MTQHEGPRAGKERPVAGRRHAFASAIPHHTPIAAAPSAAASHIPDKLYFRIGEVARLCDVPAYVLRFCTTRAIPSLALANCSRQRPGHATHSSPSLKT